MIRAEGRATDLASADAGPLGPVVGSGTAGLPAGRGPIGGMNVSVDGPPPVVHLELHTGDRAAARAFYAGVLGWRPELIDARTGSYLALELGAGLGGGIVECATQRSLWLPYVGVDRVDEQTERARQLGARVLLEPREGPAGWRSVVSTPHGGEIAFWQPKR